MLKKGSVDSGTRMTTLADLNSLMARFEGGFIGAGSEKAGVRLVLAALAQDLVGFGGSGCCGNGVGEGAVDDLGSIFLIISLNSLTDSMKASIMSKTAGWTAMLPFWRTLEAHFRQAARILSLGDREGLSEAFCKWTGDKISGSSEDLVRVAIGRFRSWLGGSGGEGGGGGMVVGGGCG